MPFSDFSCVCGYVCGLLSVSVCCSVQIFVPRASRFRLRRTGFVVGSLVGNDNRTEWMANQMVVCTSVHNYFAYRYLPPILMLITCLEGCTRIYVLNDHMQGQESSSTVNL